MKRWAILVVALLVGAAAPARAWCEATCLAAPPADSARPHCPPHQPSPDTPALSATSTLDCPALESARPVQVKQDVVFTAIAVTTRTASEHVSNLAPLHASTPAPLHLLSAPLRI